MICGWSYFPKNKGLISGITLAAYGIASSIYTPVMNYMVNPKGKSPSIDSGQEGLKYYTDDISSRVPMMWRNMCIVFAVEVFIALVLITKAPDNETKEELYDQVQDTTMTTNRIEDIDPETKEILTQYDLTSVSAAFRSVRFWQYGIMIFCGCMFYNFFAYQYKNLAGAAGIRENLITLAGTLASVA